MVNKKIESIVKKYLAVLNNSGIHIDHIYLYGSRARGDDTDSSDIDVLLVSDLFDTDDDIILSSPWIYTVQVDHRIEPVAVGTRRFNNDTGSPLLESIKREGIEIQ